MASREIRRAAAAASKKKKPETEVEKKRITHPLLYAGSVILLVIIVVTFIGTPAVTRTAGPGRISFGTYRGKSIDFYPGSYLARQRELIAESVRQEQGEQADLGDQIRRIWLDAYQRTLLHTALMMAAKEAGIAVSADRIDRAEIDSGTYSVEGRFSEELYQSTGNAERQSNRAYTREQLLAEQVVDDLLYSQLNNAREAGFFQTMAEVEKRFSFVRFPFNDYPREEIVRFGLDNQELFQKIKLSRILIKSGAREAEEIRAKLEDRSSSFEELAREHSDDVTTASKGGELGWRTYYDLERDFESGEPLATLFGLAEGEYSPVLESRFGWVIYRVDSAAVKLDLRPAGETQDAESLQLVRDYIMQYERGLVEDYFLARADEFRTRAQEIGFLLAGLEQDLATHRTGYFPLNYQGLFMLAPVRAADPGVDISSASYNRDFFLTAFALKENEVSEAVILDDQILVLKLEDQRPQPEADKEMMSRYYDYVAYQSQETDLQAVLLDPELIENRFNETFRQYILPR